ncbi:MAG TPA: 1-deoxy-D-xylulose-5-phosphate synthase [Sutterella sp.]|nr:1-deoxy-D-xylulose-5-phosphate synthase [Sutterella sp.]
MTEKNLLQTIDSPEDLRKLPLEALPGLAREIRSYIIDCVSHTGGHLSSSLGSVELALALHYVFNTPDDRLVWDVGHQAYAHKILTGRREGLKHVRQYKGLSGFPRRDESPYDAFGTAHSSTSISAALGMAVASHLQGHDKRWHVAVIGDGALTGGMASEALNHAGDYKDGVRLLIILNDNNCSISPPVGALCGHLGKLVSTSPFWKMRNLGKSILKNTPTLHELAKRMEKQTVNFLSPPSSIFSTYDLNYFGPIDGHDVVGLVRMLTKLRDLEGPMGPIVLHVRTTKGKGYAPAEKDPTTYHGVGAFNPAFPIPSRVDPVHPTYTEVFSKWICDMASVDPKLYAITPAMREGSGLVEFEKRFPERYRDVAICEQHAVTFAAGLACEGQHPVVAIYSTFAQRAYDQILHDVALQNLPVTFAVDRAGLVGADGATHHGAFDLAYLRSMPNMTIMAPSDEAECRKMLTTAVKLGAPAAVRYPRATGRGVAAGDGFETIPIGRARILRQTKKNDFGRVVFFAFGSMVKNLWETALKFDATVVDMRFVKPLDVETICRCAREHDLVVTAEEGVIAGGAGSGVLEVLSREGIVVPTLQIGLPDRFIAQGTASELFVDARIDNASVQSKISSRLQQLTGAVDGRFA